MDRFKLAVTGLILSAGTILFAACATTPPPAPVPAAAPVLMPPADPPPDEWNIFPDPTTGRVDIYNHGNYVGAVTGNEPANEDPPIPRLPARR
jgi:hypothetical protein